MKPRLGMRCVYRPRVAHGRQSELFGFITRITDAEKETVDIIVFPSHSEAVHHNNVARASDTIKLHCWEPAEADEPSDVGPLMDMIAALEAKVAALSSVHHGPTFEKLNEYSRSLEERIAQLEAKRGPGRPPKAEAA